MKKLVVGLLAVLPLAMFAVAASPVSAFEWLCGGAAILTARNCLVNGLNLEVFILEDRGVHSKIECPVEAVSTEGNILSATEGEITMQTFTGCKASAKALNLKEEEVANACEGLVELKAQNLPWTSKIEQEETKLWYILLFKAEKSEPAWGWTCKTLLGNVADLCEVATHNTLLVLGESLAEEETIEGVAGILLFDVFFPTAAELLEGTKEFLNCTFGGNEQGIVIGEHLLWGLIGGKAASLEIS